MNIVFVEYVDYGAQGEYGLFGKVVARDYVRGLSRVTIDAMIASAKRELGSHIVAVEVEEVPAV